MQKNVEEKQLDNKLDNKKNHYNNNAYAFSIIQTIVLQTGISLK